jgi:predicted lipoprotein
MPNSLVIHGSSADRVKAVRDYGNYLNTIKGGFTDTPEGTKLMKQVFDAYSDTSKSGVDAARDAFDATVKTLMQAEGADPVLVDCFSKSPSKH